MSNKIINATAIAELATVLKSLKRQMAFIGGSIIPFYADNPTSVNVRVTYDIDLTIKIGNYASWAKLQEHLASLEIYPDPDGTAMCN